MAAERGQLALLQWAGRGGAHVSLDVARRAHARDDDAHGRVTETEAKRDLRQPVDLDVEISGDRLHALPHLALALAGEVAVPEVALRERRLGPDGTRQRALAERHPHDHAYTRRFDRGEERVLGALVEDVVDHLNGVDDPRLDEPDRVVRLVVVDRDAEEPDLPVALEPFDSVEPVALSDPLVRPDVQLLD